MVAFAVVALLAARLRREIEIAGGKLVVGRVDCLINWYIADTLDDDGADKSYGRVNM